MDFSFLLPVPLIYVFAVVQGNLLSFVGDMEPVCRVKNCGVSRMVGNS